MNNADLPYRPLLGCVSLLNARVREPGTLGCFGRDSAGAAWLVSAYHVLCNADLAAYRADEAIYQPAAELPAYAVADTRAARANAALDCAAALLRPGIACRNAQLGLGPTAAAVAAEIGMRVVKAGTASGITEGIVRQIDGDTLRIEADPAFDDSYVLSTPGDSGALWVEQATRAPVALHRGHLSPRRADAVAIASVLVALSLELL